MTEAVPDPDWGFLRDPTWTAEGPVRSRGWSLTIFVDDGLSQHRDAAFVLRTHLFNAHDRPVTTHTSLIAGDPELAERQVDVSVSIDGTTIGTPRIERFKRVNYAAVVDFPGQGLLPDADAWLDLTWSWPHSANVDGGQWVRGLRTLVPGGTFEVSLRHPVEVAQTIRAWVTDDDGTIRRELEGLSVTEVDGFQVTRVAGVRQDVREHQLRIQTEPESVAEGIDENQALLRGVARMHDQALRALRQISAQMQEWPGTLSTHSEPNLRAQILTALDQAVPGQVTGESVSLAGKTDIMIRHDSQTILIVECKKWRGPKSLDGAVNQVLSYSALHQSRLAVLLFVTGGRVDQVRADARTAIESRADFEEWGTHLRNDHLRAVLRREQDASERVQLAVIFVFLT